MVAKQRLHTSPGGGGFLLQTHDQVKHRDAVRSTINKIPHKPERGITPAPRVRHSDQFRILQQLDEFFQLTVNIANDVDGGGSLDFLVLHGYSCSSLFSSPETKRPGGLFVF